MSPKSTFVEAAAAELALALTAKTARSTERRGAESTDPRR
jgi:hypothetical protein